MRRVELSQSSGASMSNDRRYRYELWRLWNHDLPPLVWLMLNPSTADWSLDDPTIRKCKGFARRMGAGGIAVINLFAYRATDKRELLRTPDPVGAGNDEVIERVVRDADAVVCGWGQAFHPIVRRRVEHVAEVIGCEKWRCFRITKDGQPSHPLYLPYDAQLQHFTGEDVG